MSVKTAKKRAKPQVREMFVRPPVKRCARLRGKIVEKYGSNREFAKAIGLTEQAVTAKLSGRASWRQIEIIRWCNALELSIDDIPAYFFYDDAFKFETYEK